MQSYAHSRTGEDERNWELLDEHLRQVAAKAATLAAAFDAEHWGRVAGLWHDLGKYRPEFQARLRGERIQAEHAGVGAALALEKGHAGVPVAFAIAGHHSGLANLSAQGDSERRPLLLRIKDNKAALKAVTPVVPPEILDVELPALPEWLQKPADRDAQRLSAEMFTRFVFSALVDADRLCTEAFYEPSKRIVRRSETVAVLSERLDSHIDALSSSVDSGAAVNRSRKEVLRACRTRADEPPGLFSLTVPTGGGKTLSAMSFALRHAVRHGLRRVIVVIPFTSIIEQNARIYALALGEENVIEHHSSLDETKAAEENPERETRRQLAAENWDAPVIVTTTVQFFESLFSAHPSRCRKLHNVANSVIVLDEVQTLPPGLLSPILDGLQELARHYGCSVVLSTATPPALSQPHLSFGLTAVREIVPHPASLAAELRRVEVKWPEPGEFVSCSGLSGLMAAQPQVLAIVHLRKDARQLAELLPADGRYHLSALMCPARPAWLGFQRPQPKATSGRALNALLSFLYTLLLHDARSALEAAGLDSQVGFLHRDRPGRPSLALDLMEEFRAFLCDRLALSLVNRRQLDSIAFDVTPVGGVVMDHVSRKIVLEAYQRRKREEMMHPFIGEKVSVGLLVHLQSRLLARFLRGDLDAYPAFLWK